MTSIEGIMTTGKLEKAITSMSSRVPSLPENLKNKHRWINITVFNKSQYNLVYKEHYFNSGRFWTAPTNVNPFNQMTFSGCNKDGTIWTGVSGGSLFTLQMPKKGGGYEELDIGIGFSNPEDGALKSSAIFNPHVKEAYEKITDQTTTEHSLSFSGNNTDNKSSEIKFLLVSSPGQEPSITITEQILSESD